MKNLTIVSLESVFSGAIITGMAELVDSLANSLTSHYNVNLIVPDWGGNLAYSYNTTYKFNENVTYIKFSNVNYYMVNQDVWIKELTNLLNFLQTDIFHNFASTVYINYFKERPSKAIFTVDNINNFLGSYLDFKYYDYITTVSENYAKEILSEDTEVSNYLKTVNNFIGITNGVLSSVINPEKGFLITSSYSAEYQNGKKLCKKKFLNTYGIEGDPAIYLMVCRMVEAKGIESVLEVLPQIKKNNGIVVFGGLGDEKYQSLLKELTLKDGVFYIDKQISNMSLLSLISAADFCLSPSKYEPCGLMPMNAAVYGAIPIVTQVGGLKDNFNQINAIISPDGNLNDAILKATYLYEHPDKLYDKRKKCMSYDFSWESRKLYYIELYEN